MAGVLDGEAGTQDVLFPRSQWSLLSAWASHYCSHAQIQRGCSRLHVAGYGPWNALATESLGQVLLGQPELGQGSEVVDAGGDDGDVVWGDCVADGASSADAIPPSDERL